MKEDKQIVINYFKTKFIEARPYPKKENGKNPDFELYLESKLFGLCELKTIIFYDFIGERLDPTFNNIQNKIHEASKQFKDSNPNHNIPNILIFVNHNSLIRIEDLWYVLTGNVCPGTEIFDFRYSNRLKKKKDFSYIDYFIWIDESVKTIYYISNFINPVFKDSLKTKISSRPYEPYNF